MIISPAVLPAAAFSFPSFSVLCPLRLQSSPHLTLSSYDSVSHPACLQPHRRPESSPFLLALTRLAPPGRLSGPLHMAMALAGLTSRRTATGVWCPWRHRWPVPHSQSADKSKWNTFLPQVLLISKRYEQFLSMAFHRESFHFAIKESFFLFGLFFPILQFPHFVFSACCPQEGPHQHCSLQSSPPTTTTTTRELRLHELRLKRHTPYHTYAHIHFEHVNYHPWRRSAHKWKAPRIVLAWRLTYRPSGYINWRASQAKKWNQLILDKSQHEHRQCVVL